MRVNLRSSSTIIYHRESVVVLNSVIDRLCPGLNPMTVYRSEYLKVRNAFRREDHFSKR